MDVGRPGTPLLDGVSVEWVDQSGAPNRRTQKVSPRPAALEETVHRERQEPTYPLVKLWTSPSTRSHVTYIHVFERLKRCGTLDRIYEGSKTGEVCPGMVETTEGTLALNLLATVIIISPASLGRTSRLGLRPTLHDAHPSPPPTVY